jgi:hypothetical protein
MLDRGNLLTFEVFLNAQEIDGSRGLHDGKMPNDLPNGKPACMPAF